MLFNSYVFLLLFLPLTWCIYFGLNRCKCYRLAQAALILASFFFYGYQDKRLCLLLMTSILINYLIHCCLTNRKFSLSMRHVLLSVGLVFNFSLLFYFKYVDFALRNINLLTGTKLPMQEIILPLGISFYTFQQVSFVVDSYRQKMKKYHFMDYALFVSFFPQLVAGPIVLHQEMVPQFGNAEKKKINYSNMISGVEYLIIGFAKKVLIADSFARICDAGFDAVGSLNSLSAVVVILSYTMQIYFDFSGYCDMAIGIGKLFNIDIPINFRSPYKAVNIGQFWERWHITLTRFLTSYLYIPLGGNRRGKWRTYLNVMIIFTLSGLWHGADWNFVLWGMLHGVMMVLYRMGKDKVDRMPKVIMWAVTFILLNMTWVFFRADYFMQPFLLFGRIFSGGWEILPSLTQAFLAEGTSLIFMNRLLPAGWSSIAAQVLLLIWTAGGTAICVIMPGSHEIIGRQCRKTWYYLYLGIIFSVGLSWLSQVSTFIYFNF